MRQARFGLGDAQVLLARAGDLGLYRDLDGCLPAVRLALGREEVRLPVLAAEDQRYLVVEIPGIAHRVDLLAGQMADAALTVEDAQAHAVGYFRVVVLSNPLRN